MYKIVEKDFIDLYKSSNNEVLKERLRNQYDFIKKFHELNESKKVIIPRVLELYTKENIFSFVYKCVAKFIENKFCIDFDIDDYKSYDEFYIYARRWTAKYLKDEFGFSVYYTSEQFRQNTCRALNKSVARHDLLCDKNELYKIMHDKCCAFIDNELYLLYQNQLNKL